jgi:hypothetical protein
VVILTVFSSKPQVTKTKPELSKSSSSKNYSLKFLDLTPDDPEFASFNNTIEVKENEQKVLDLILPYEPKNIKISGFVNPNSNIKITVIDGLKLIGNLTANSNGEIPFSVLKYPFSKYKSIPIRTVVTLPNSFKIILEHLVSHNQLIALDTLIKYKYSIYGTLSTPDGTLIEIFDNDSLYSSGVVSDGKYSISWEGLDSDMVIDSIRFSKDFYVSKLERNMHLYTGINKRLEFVLTRASYVFTISGNNSTPSGTIVELFKSGNTIAKDTIDQNLSYSMSITRFYPTFELDSIIYSHPEYIKQVIIKPKLEVGNNIININLEKIKYDHHIKGVNTSPCGTLVEVFDKGMPIEVDTVDVNNDYQINIKSILTDLIIDSIRFRKEGYFTQVFRNITLKTGINMIEANLKNAILINYRVHGFAFNEFADTYLDRGQIELGLLDEIHTIDIKQDGTFDASFSSLKIPDDSITISLKGNPYYSYNTFGVLKQGSVASVSRICASIDIPVYKKETAKTTLGKISINEGICLYCVSDSSANNQLIKNHLNGYVMQPKHAYGRDSIIFFNDTVYHGQDLLDYINGGYIRQEFDVQQDSALKFFKKKLNTPIGIKLAHSDLVKGDHFKYTNINDLNKRMVLYRTYIMPSGCGFNYGLLDKNTNEYYYGSAETIIPGNGYSCMISEVGESIFGIIDDFSGSNHLGFTYDNNNITGLSNGGKVAMYTTFFFPSMYFDYKKYDYFFKKVDITSDINLGGSFSYFDFANSLRYADASDTWIHLSLLNKSPSDSIEIFMKDPINEYYTLIQNFKNPITFSKSDSLYLKLPELLLAKNSNPYYLTNDMVTYIICLDRNALRDSTLDEFVNGTNGDKHRVWDFYNNSKRSKTYSILNTFNMGSIPVPDSTINQVKQILNLFSSKYSTDEGLQIMETTIEEISDPFSPQIEGHVYISFDQSYTQPIVSKLPTNKSNFNKTVIQLPLNSTYNDIFKAISEEEGIINLENTSSNRAFIFDAKNKIADLSNLGLKAFRISNTFKAGSFKINRMPEVITSQVSNIGYSTVISGGTITYEGTLKVLNSGVCWNTLTNPNIENYRTVDTCSSGSFIANMSGLDPNTTYFLRAYVTNEIGTIYGNEVVFKTIGPLTDIDGNVYGTISIGDQIWTTENLKTTKLNDGTEIPNITNGTTWSSLATPAYCWYNNSIDTYRNIYGGLYNWYSVNYVQSVGMFQVIANGSL